MVDQAKVNGADGAARADSPPRAVARSAGELVSDLVTLAELQGRLVVVDAREGVSKILWPAAVLAAGILVGVACVPVALAALALTLVETTHLTQSQAFGIALVIGLLIASGLAGGAIWYLHCCSAMFQRSRTEWRQNVKWAKDAIQRLSKDTHGPSAARVQSAGYR
jgi:putative superfamily III holin-X